MTIQIGDIVAFDKSAVFEAAAFCHAKGITGKVVRAEAGMFVVDAGFDYEIFVKPDHLSLIAAYSEIPHPIGTE